MASALLTKQKSAVSIQSTERKSRAADVTITLTPPVGSGPNAGDAKGNRPSAVPKPGGKTAKDGKGGKKDEKKGAVLEKKDTSPDSKADLKRFHKNTFKGIITQLVIALNGAEEMASDTSPGARYGGSPGRGKGVVHALHEMRYNVKNLIEHTNRLIENPNKRELVNPETLRSIREGQTRRMNQRMMKGQVCPVQQDTSVPYTKLRKFVQRIAKSVGDVMKDINGLAGTPKEISLRERWFRDLVTIEAKLNAQKNMLDEEDHGSFMRRKNRTEKPGQSWRHPACNPAPEMDPHFLRFGVHSNSDHLSPRGGLFVPPPRHEPVFEQSRAHDHKGKDGAEGPSDGPRPQPRYRDVTVSYNDMYKPERSQSPPMAMDAVAKAQIPVYKHHGLPSSTSGRMGRNFVHPESSINLTPTSSVSPERPFKSPRCIQHYNKQDRFLRHLDKEEQSIWNDLDELQEKQAAVAAAARAKSEEPPPRPEHHEHRHHEHHEETPRTDESGDHPTTPRNKTAGKAGEAPGTASPVIRATGADIEKLKGPAAKGGKGGGKAPATQPKGAGKGLAPPAAKAPHPAPAATLAPAASAPNHATTSAAPRAPSPAPRGDGPHHATTSDPPREPTERRGVRPATEPPSHQVPEVVRVSVASSGGGAPGSSGGGAPGSAAGAATGAPEDVAAAAETAAEAEAEAETGAEAETREEADAEAAEEAEADAAPGLADDEETF